MFILYQEGWNIFLKAKIWGGGDIAVNVLHYFGDCRIMRLGDFMTGHGILQDPIVFTNDVKRCVQNLSPDPELYFYIQASVVLYSSVVYLTFYTPMVMWVMWLDNIWWRPLDFLFLFWLLLCRLPVYYTRGVFSWGKYFFICIFQKKQKKPKTKNQPYFCLFPCIKPKMYVVK